jgi:hypothetical protein
MNKKLILPLVIGAGVIGLYFLIKKRNSTTSATTIQPQTGSQETTTPTATKPLTFNEIRAKYKKFIV